jgi:hypothetical protein
VASVVGVVIAVTSAITIEIIEYSSLTASLQELPMMLKVMNR